MELINKSERNPQRLSSPMEPFRRDDDPLLAGGEVNRGFGFALTFGCITGTYSTIYVASAVVLDYTNRKLPKTVGSQIIQKPRHEPVKQGT